MSRVVRRILNKLLGLYQAALKCSPFLWGILFRVNLESLFRMLACQIGVLIGIPAFGTFQMHRTQICLDSGPQKRRKLAGENLRCMSETLKRLFKIDSSLARRSFDIGDPKIKLCLSPHYGRVLTSANL